MLAFARDCESLSVTLDIPGIAEVCNAPMATAMRTGGKYELSEFVQMFDAALEELARGWQLLRYGFKLQRTGHTIANVNWVDNTYILDSIDECSEG